MKHEKETILIVDDDPVSLKMLEVFLTSGGYNVRQAENGSDAVQKAEEKPDLILLDLLMPGIDGFETCRRLKENEATKNIPVIFLSTRQDSKARVNGLNLGGVDYVNKPFDVSELLARVRTHLTIQRQEMELADYAKKLEQMVEQRTQQLIHADRLASLGTFSAAIAHEINNPLMYIGGNMELLTLFWELAMPVLERHADEDETGELARTLPGVEGFCKSIEEGSRRISDIVSTLRDYGKKGALRKAPCRLIDPINDALRLLSPRLKRGASVETAVPDELRILCDRRKISQVFVNLLSNALDTMNGSGAEISIRAKAADGRVAIRVKDSGPGIPDHLSKTVFDPFFTTKGETQGTGLGLFIVQSILEEHRGRIFLAPFDGTGAEFQIELPLQE